MSEKTILVVEDDFLVRMTLAEGLLDAGFTVVEVDSAEDALAELDRRQDIDLIIADVRLAGPMRGDALPQALQARGLTIPVMLTTGESHAGTDIPGLIRITKPYSLDMVLQRIGAVLA